MMIDDANVGNSAPTSDHPATLPESPMPLCHECSAPFVPTTPLAAQVCASCGECPSVQCRDCANHFALYELENMRCEECHAANERASTRDRRDAIEEGRGDWLRDEGKDRRVLP